MSCEGGRIDEDSPLPLPQRRRTTSGSSDLAEAQGTFGSSVVSLSASAMGSGVLALPRVFASCGVRWGLAFLVVFSVWVDMSLRWVVACGRYSGRRGFYENAKFFLGPEVAGAVHCSQIMLLFGGIVTVFVTAASLLACCAQEILASLCTGDLADSLQPFCQAAHPAECMPRERVLLLIALLVFPWACQKSLHALTGISMLSFCCLLYFFLVLLFRLGGAVLSSAEGPWSFFRCHASPAPEIEAFWQGPPVLLMSLLCHTSILQLDVELKADSKQHIGRVVHTVILGTALPLYILVGLGGFWLHGMAVSPNILEDFHGDVLMAVARMTLGFMSVAKLASAVVTLREALIGSLRRSQLRRWLRSGPGRALNAAVVLSLTALAASAMGSLSSVLSLTGSTVGVLFSLCLPAALHGALLRDLAAKRRDCQDSLLEPLLPGSSSTTPSRSPSNTVVRGCGAVAGALALPSSQRDWLWQWAACSAVFAGGLSIGILGLVSWMDAL